MNAENIPMRISGLCVDITEQVRLLDEVEKSRTHLRQLSRSLVEVQESERHEIAKELHDEIGQVLTGLKLKIEMSTRMAPAPIQKSLHEALTVLSDLMQRVSELSLNLRPAMLDDLGLLPALIWQFERYSTLTGIHVVFDHTPLELRLPHEVESTAYRIIQEALTNVARHAGVNEVIVRVWTTPNSLGLQVVDYGKGFNRDEVKTSAKIGGLAGMEERAGLAGGWMTVESSSQAGTCLTAELPLKDSMEDDE
jgi:signal transduction histidine kinase